MQSLFQDVLSFWLSHGVDGFRADAVRHLYEVEDLLQDQQISNVPNTSPVSVQSLSKVYGQGGPKDHILVYKLLNDSSFPLWQVSLIKFKI